jgi:transcriptional regulator with XRE-family HTH domain
VKGDGARARVKGRPDPIDVQVGQRVRISRMLAGMSQAELANAINVTFQQLQKYERGLNRISASRLKAIADKLGVAISHFFDDLKSDVSVREAWWQQTEALELVRFYYAIPEANRHLLLQLAKALADRRSKKP